MDITCQENKAQVVFDQKKKKERQCKKEFHGNGAHNIDYSDKEQIQDRFVPMTTKTALIKYHLTR